MPHRGAGIVLAIALAAALTAGWAAQDWAMIARSYLPDTDDVMRLAEIRDWLGGQAFNDLAQHRLGSPGGLPMHWSRLADLGPAALILTLTPLLGRIGAEQAMLVVYPAGLFVAAMLVAGRLADHMSPGTRLIAIVVTALSFPAASLFVPGRIDHHGLQILLVLWFVERLVAPSTARAGAGAGLAAALSLAVGLETLPLILAGMAALLWRYAEELPSSAGFNRQLAAFAVALGGMTLILLLSVRPMFWSLRWCDGFTPGSSVAMLTAAAFFAVLAVTAPRVKGAGQRLSIAAIAGACALPVLLHGSAACFAGPYAPVDPLLRQLWLPYVGEARGLLEQASLGRAIGYGAMTLMATIVLAVSLWRGKWRQPRWRTFAIIFVPGVLLALMQVRATYVVSALAVIPIAALIADVRACITRPLPRVGVWALGAGMIWNQLGLMIDARLAPAAAAESPACGRADQARALAGLPPGRIIAPLDSGAIIIGNSAHEAVGAPYHRNNAGNAAVYRFFLGSEAQARSIAKAWQVDYVMLCPDSFSELGPLARQAGRTVTTLIAGHPPQWLRRIGDGAGPLVYRVQPDGASGRAR